MPSSPAEPGGGNEPTSHRRSLPVLGQRDQGVPAHVGQVDGDLLQAQVGRVPVAEHRRLVRRHPGASPRRGERGGLGLPPHASACLTAFRTRRPAGAQRSSKGRPGAEVCLRSRSGALPLASCRRMRRSDRGDLARIAENVDAEPARRSGGARTEAHRGWPPALRRLRRGADREGQHSGGAVLAIRRGASASPPSGGSGSCRNGFAATSEKTERVAPVMPPWLPTSPVPRGVRVSPPAGGRVVAYTRSGGVRRRPNPLPVAVRRRASCPDAGRLFT